MENEPKKIGLTGLCAAAEKVMETAVHDEEIATIRLSDESESVRWFVLPHEV